MNSITVDELLNSKTEINLLISDLYTDPNAAAQPIYDGVLVPDLYVKAKTRILWILKEPWDGKDLTGGGWNLCEDILAKKPVTHFSRSTFYPIIYITFGLLNGISRFNEIPDVNAMENPEGILRQIAFINAKKLPGVRRGAHAPTVMHWYNKGKEAVLKQIVEYAPNVVFGCSPHMPAILKDIDPELPQKLSWRNSAAYVNYKNTTYLLVYHPGQTKMSWEIYVDDALNAAVSGIESQN